MKVHSLSMLILLTLGTTAKADSASIKQLGSPKFADREMASKALIVAIGVDGELMEAAETHADAEVRKRAGDVLAQRRQRGLNQPRYGRDRLSDMANRLQLDRWVETMIANGQRDQTNYTAYSNQLRESVAEKLVPIVNRRQRFAPINSEVWQQWPPAASSSPASGLLTETDVFGDEAGLTVLISGHRNLEMKRGMAESSRIILGPSSFHVQHGIAYSLVFVDGDLINTMPGADDPRSVEGILHIRKSLVICNNLVGKFSADQSLVICDGSCWAVGARGSTISAGKQAWKELAPTGGSLTANDDIYHRVFDLATANRWGIELVPSTDGPIVKAIEATSFGGSGKNCFQPGDAIVGIDDRKITTIREAERAFCRAMVRTGECGVKIKRSGAVVYRSLVVPDLPNR